MAGTTTAVCDTFKAELGTATHNFTITTGNVFKIALVKVSPTGTYGHATTNYSDLTGNSDEVANGNGYTTGGFAWTAAQNLTPVVNGGQGCYSWSVNPSWTSASFSTTGGIIYNSSSSNKATSVYDFGGTQTVTSGTLTLTLPAQTANNAIIQIR